MKEITARVNQFLLFWILFTIVLIYGKPILIPLAFAALLSMLMAPFVDFLDRKGFNRVFSTIVCIIILLIVIVLAVLLLIGQIANIQQELPTIEQKANDMLQWLHDYIETHYQYPVSMQKQFLQKQIGDWVQSSGMYLSQLLSGASGVLVQVIITLVVTFLLLFGKEKYHIFFMRVVKIRNQGEKRDILDRITQVSQQYLIGRMISIVVLFILYYISLLVIGVPNALLLAAVAAVVNIIPYVGPILAAVFPIIMALVTMDSYQSTVWVIILFILIQGIDNYFVTPFFMGGELSLSALATILIIICGGYVWGIAGMILFVPLLSIARIIFTHVDTLKPYGELLSDPAREKPSTRFHKWMKAVFDKA